jgi:hypothetical protein
VRTNVNVGVKRVSNKNLCVLRWVDTLPTVSIVLSHSYRHGRTQTVQGTILHFDTNPADFTDRSPLLRIYLTVQTSACADNVLPVLSPFLTDGAFADKMLQVLSLFLTDRGICG